MQQVESDVTMIEQALWLPCVRKTTTDKFLQEVHDSFSFSLDIPLKTAVASGRFALHASKHAKGVEVGLEPGDVLLRPPLVLGLLSARPNEWLGDPFVGVLFT